MSLPSIPPLAVFFFVGLAGMIVHYAKQRAAGEVTDGLIQHALITNRKRTASAICSFVAAEALAFSTGALDAVSTSTLVALAFTTGFTLDSGVCKKADAS